jgi:hypothetical protein
MHVEDYHLCPLGHLGLLEPLLGWVRSAALDCVQMELEVALDPFWKSFCTWGLCQGSFHQSLGTLWGAFLYCSDDEDLASVLIYQSSTLKSLTVTLSSLKVLLPFPL